MANERAVSLKQPDQLESLEGIDIGQLSIEEIKKMKNTVLRDALLGILRAHEEGSVNCHSSHYSQS